MPYIGAAGVCVTGWPTCGVRQGDAGCGIGASAGGEATGAKPFAAGALYDACITFWFCWAGPAAVAWPGCGIAADAAAIGVAGSGFNGAGSANRSSFPSVGTATAGSFPTAIGAGAFGAGSQGDADALATCVAGAAGTPGAVPAGAFQANVRPDDERASAPLVVAATALAGGAVALCITGNGSPG
jgi:hypothetical protein